jgi:acyl-coenzyme A synthetase/AMP-(fatty) acid ligase
MPNSNEQNSHFFYVSDNDRISYANLIERLNETVIVYDYYLAQNYIEFAVNTINAIINNLDITLLDYRNLKYPIEFGDRIYNEIKASVNNNIDHFDDIVNKVKSSSASVGIYSSGTESKPKLIFQEITRLLQAVRIEDEYANSGWAFTYNPSHSAGIQMLLQVLCNQATLYDMYKSSRDKILKILNEFKINYVSATPTFYRMLAPYNFKIEGVLSVTLNGEKSTNLLIHSVKLVFPNAKIRNIYGSTEAGPLMSSDSTTFIIPQRLIDRIKIDSGQLFLKSSMVSESVQEGEWYATGDLIEVVSEAPLSIKFVSRKSRIVNVGGHNVNPQEIEEILLTHPLIKDARVFGKPSKLIGNVLSAEIQLVIGSYLTEKHLIDFCKSKIVNYKMPRIIKFVSEIKSGNTGKKAI